jgi:hypothetical protein
MRWYNSGRGLLLTVPKILLTYPKTKKNGDASHDATARSINGIPGPAADHFFTLLSICYPGLVII